MNQRTLLLLPVLLVAVAGAMCGRAEAHIRATPAQVDAGTDATLVFHCPNERSDASTIQVVVQLPQDVVLPSVRVLATAGWESHVTMRTLEKPVSTPHGPVTAVVDTITWSGGRINPGERHDFSIVAGPMPSAPAELVFKALQTYSSGEVVRWIQLRNPGEGEPPFPAPVVGVR
jgi:uncharacterized protein YcnI